MKFLVHLYAVGDRVAFAGEFDVEADAAAHVRERYPLCYATPATRDADGTLSILLFPDVATLHQADVLFHGDGGSAPCGRVIATFEGTELLARPKGPWFDFELWLPPELADDVRDVIAQHATPGERS